MMVSSSSGDEAEAAGIEDKRLADAPTDSADTVISASDAGDTSDVSDGVADDDSAVDTANSSASDGMVPDETADAVSSEGEDTIVAMRVAGASSSSDTSDTDDTSSDTVDAASADTDTAVSDASDTVEADAASDAGEADGCRGC